MIIDQLTTEKIISIHDINRGKFVNSSLELRVTLINNIN